MKMMNRIKYKMAATIGAGLLVIVGATTVMLAQNQNRSGVRPLSARRRTLIAYRVSALAK